MSSADDWVNDSSAHESPVWTCDECRHCGESSPEEQRLLLWDGHAYCRACIGAASPELLAYAMNHQTIQETLPLSAWIPFKRTFAVGYIGCTAVSGTALVLVAWQMGPREAIHALLLTQAGIIPMSLLFAAVRGLRFAFRRPSATVGRGRLTLCAGNSWSITRPLDQCEWLLGSLSQSSHVGDVLLPSMPALVLVVPRDEPTGEEHFAAVGLASGSRAVWQAFLELAGVRRRVAWEAPARRLGRILDAAGVLCLLAVFPGCILLARGITAMLERLAVRPDVAESAGFAFFVPGCLFAFFLLIVEWPWSSVLVHPSTRPAGAQRTMERRLAMGFVALGGMVSLTYLAVEGKGVVARIVYAALSMGLGLAAGIRFGRRTARFEFSNARPGNDASGESVNRIE